MTDRPDPWFLVPEPIRRLPADLAFVLLVTAATVLAVVTPVLNQTLLRAALSLPLMLFVPGYALVAALFPEAGERPGDPDENGTDPDSATERTGIDGMERVALSFGTSIAIVPVIGLLLNFTPFGIQLAPVVVSLSGFIVAITVLAARRRRQVPESDRLVVPYREWVRTVRTTLTEPDSRYDKALNVLVVVSVLLAASSVGYAVAFPKQGEAFTEFYLLTEQDDGTLVADDYPTEFTTGEPRPIVVGIGNHEHERTRYSLVVKLQEVRFQNNSTTVRDERELRRLQTTVADEGTWQTQLDISPTMTGERLRLAFLLYKTDPPADPTLSNAYRETHLWVNVSAPTT